MAEEVKTLVITTPLELHEAESSLEIEDTVCPDCGGNLYQRVGKCGVCLECGFSRCEV